MQISSTRIKIPLSLTHSHSLFLPFSIPLISFPASAGFQVEFQQIVDVHRHCENTVATNNKVIIIQV